MPKKMSKQLQYTTKMDAQITDANFWRRTDAVSRFSGEAHDPWTRVVNVDLGITRMDGRQCNAIPTA